MLGRIRYPYLAGIPNPCYISFVRGGKMHSLLLLATLGLVSPGTIASRDLQQKVSFESRAARVEVLFPELSKAAGVRFHFSSQVKDEVLIVSVRDVPMN